MYSVYSLTLNRYVEHQKAQESYRPLPLFTFYWRAKITQESILYCSMYCQKPFISIIDFVLLFGSESMLTTQPKVSFVEFLVVPCLLGWFAPQSN
jgi:hypothetical protein